MESPSEKITTRPETHRRSALGYLDYVPGARSLRYNLNREKLIETFKTMIWVIPLTLLIWVYAEREQIIYPTSPNANNVIVQLFSSNSRKEVEPAGNTLPLTVNLKLTGPQDSIEQVKQLLNGIPRGVSIDAALMPVGDNQPINIVDRIQNLPVFKTNGVSVIESQPPEVLVNVDDKITMDNIPVEISPADAATLSQSRFDPPRVSVQGPARALAIRPHVYADLSLALKNVGEQPAQSVPLKLASPDVRLAIVPTKVNATLIVKASDVTYTINAIPIVVEASPATLRSYDVTSINNGDDSLGTTELTGPPDQIDAIKLTPSKAKAILDLSYDDFIRQEPKRVRYDLPPGVRVTGDNAEKKVEFKMTARNLGG